ncbi:charged multivesicular body protein 5 [Reticulomyxa filosa]|uniref:Charged multivesicular body protein 5 n=1 Tax=Reticulomyxa filosa TaxID=46433 RepID=X6PAI6_RETFI|nr:charged multivesicular body protein 5 [Reticulomyxa filosa]|eukprot:ETO35074.1 charged multivesicular body protein 5 [Reticulomyxa filosa]
MNRFFGKKKPEKEEAPKPTLDDVSGRVKDVLYDEKQMDKRTTEIDTKIARLDKQIVEVKKKMQKAKGAAKNSYKKKALQLLKQRKQFVWQGKGGKGQVFKKKTSDYLLLTVNFPNLYEVQRDRIMGQQMNIDSAKFATESLKDNAEMVSAMKDTATTIKQQYKEINIDDVEDLQDEMRDLMEDANEINDVLGEAWGVDDLDENDLLEDAEEEIPDYMVSAASAANKDKQKDNGEVDEYGLPKVPEKMMN